MLANPLHQCRRKTRRHQEAHELAAPPRGHIDADDKAVGGDGRPTAHAGIERPGEVDALVVAVPHQAVIGAFADGEAEVEWITHGIEAFALRQAARHRSFVEGKVRRVMLVEANDREVVRQVDA